MKETKELLLGNISKLPLKVLLDTQYPFQLMQEGDPSERSNMVIFLINTSIFPLCTNAEYAALIEDYYSMYLYWLLYH